MTSMVLLCIGNFYDIFMVLFFDILFKNSSVTLFKISLCVLIK